MMKTTIEPLNIHQMPKEKKEDVTNNENKSLLKKQSFKIVMQ